MSFLVGSSLVQGASDLTGIDPLGTLKSGLNELGNLFGIGGSSCSPQQKQKKRQLAQQIDQLLTRSEKVQLTSNMNSNVSPTGSDMADFFYGGRDCKHKNVGAKDQRFLDQLPRTLTAKANQLQQQQQQQQQNQFNAGAGSSPNYLMLGAIIAGAYLIFNS